MPNAVLTFNVEDTGAQAAFSQLQREVNALDREFTTTQREARETGAAIDALGHEAQQSATHAKALHTEITALTTAIDGRTGTSMQGLHRQLREKQAALEAVHAQLGTHANALRELTAANTSTATAAQDASKETDRFARTLAHLRTTADDTTDARTHSRERVRMEQSANSEIIAGFATVVQAAKDAVRARVAFAQQLAAIPDIERPDAQYGKPLTAGLRQDFQETARQGRSLLRVMQAIANIAYRTDGAERIPEPLDRGVAIDERIPEPLDRGVAIDERIPEPLDRGVTIDERIAEAARGAQTLTDIRHAAAEQGRQFLRQVHRSEERDTQQSLNVRAKHYQQFTNLVSNTFVGLAAGRTRSFESVATAFIEHSIRLISRAVIENQILKRLDDGLTAAKLANLRKVEAAQQAGGIGNVLGQLPGLSPIGNLGGALSGGGLALGAASLLFPEQIRNLTGGIADTLKGVLENVSHQPVVVKANIQNNLRIGENEAREISDIQAEMKADDRL